MRKNSSFVDYCLMMLRLTAGAGFCAVFTQCGSTPRVLMTPAVSTPVAIQIGDGTADVLTYHNDISRSGVQSKEPYLTPAVIQSASFGKLGTLPADGSVYAQPLVISNVPAADGSSHTIMLCATSKNSVFAYDASTLQLLWAKSLMAAGEFPVTFYDTGTYDMAEIGITGTPVVDPATNIVYVVSKSKLPVAGQSNQYFVRLHALHLSDGTEAFSGPVTIQATASGAAEDAVNGVLFFDPLRENQRAALLLSQGVVWIAFASHGDIQYYHGWLLGYDASTLAQKYAFNTSPNGYSAGIWSAANGPAADSAGSIFAAIGNGLADGYSSFGSSAVRMTPGSSGQVVVSDFYTPADQTSLTQFDQDFGIMGSTLLPPQSGPVPNLLMTGAKDGTLYVINRDKMGGFGNDAALVQTWNVGAHLHANGIFFNNTFYLGPDKSTLQAFTFDPVHEAFSTAPSSQTTHTFTTLTGAWVSGTGPTVSANGTANGVIWAIDNDGLGNMPAVLYAFDATDLGKQLFSSALSGSDDAAHPVKFTVPTVAYGRVFVGGYMGVTAYGLRSQILQ